MVKVSTQLLVRGTRSVNVNACICWRARGDIECLNQRNEKKFMGTNTVQAANDQSKSKSANPYSATT